MSDSDIDRCSECSSTLVSAPYDGMLRCSECGELREIDEDEDAVFVVYSDGPTGATYPYGVFETRKAAENAREAIITELDTTANDVLNSEERQIAHQLAGTLDGQTKIKECQIRSELSEGDLDDLFEDYE